MSEEGELNEMERNMVLQYVKSQDPQMTVALEQGSVDSGDSPVFPIGIPGAKLSVFPNGAFVFDYSIRALEPFVDKKVRVQFYYNHLGLHFTSLLQRTQQGYAVVVPLKLHRIGEVKSYSKDDFRAVVSYTVNGRQAVELPCVPDKEFDLFSRPSWKSVESYMHSAVQQYYERFAYDLSPREGEDISYLISVCRYITRPQETESVEGTAKPYDIIYIDTSRIILGSRGGEASLLKISSAYRIVFEFGVFANDFFKRVIRIDISVSDIYSGKDGQKCFVCIFSGMKAEDERFLYEKFSGQRMGGK
ncbi:MAG: hypothetical protein IJU95_03020 [Treponema sp.]|nr:hypothetical protein [Treponema sp.]